MWRFISLCPNNVDLEVENGKFETLSDCKTWVSKFKTETLKKAETQRRKVTQKQDFETYQGSALAEPGGPWHLTFALR